MCIEMSRQYRSLCLGSDGFGFYVHRPDSLILWEISDLEAKTALQHKGIPLAPEIPNEG